MSDRRRAWTWRHAILESDLKPTTRHVLLTISCHMNDVGEGCYPTTKDLQCETGLSERAVCEHINLAVAAGWLKKFQHGFRGQKWKQNEYRPAWPKVSEDAEKGTDPDDKKALTDGQYLAKGTDAGSVEGTDPNDIKALTQGQQDKTSQETSQSLSHTAREEISAGERVCEIFNLNLGAWQMRVAEHFIAPLERVLQVRPKQATAMADLVSDLSGYSIATLQAAAASIRRARSVFPTIAQAVEACKAASKATVKPCHLRSDDERRAWRRHLEATGNRIALKLFAGGSTTMVDAELLADAMALYGDDANSEAAP